MTLLIFVLSVATSALVFAYTVICITLLNAKRRQSIVRRSGIHSRGTPFAR